MTAARGEHRVIGGRYRVLRTLGAGAHGTVDLAEDVLNGGHRVAVKRLEAIVGAGDPEPAAEVLRWFRHPNWAEILDEGRLDEHGRFQVTRYVPGHSLDHIEVPRPCDEVMRFLEDGARVLRALHRRGLLHYDVTPGNWLREDGPDGARFTLTDGGLASVGPVRGVARGTPAFMAPEVVEGAPHDHRADLYSLGLVAWRLATGGDPHGVGGAGEVLGRRRRVAAPLLRRVRPDAPAGLERILAALLERDPERRVADGGALLALLAEAGRTTAQEDLLADEAVAAASGGAFVGHAAPRARFRAACRALLQESPPPATDGATPAPRDEADAVLVLQGPSGSGATRLVRELAAAAREDGLATLALSGRAGAADRRSALRRVADALAALLGEDAGLVVPREDRNAAELAATADARAIERFLEACERAAARLPIVLLVEDFAELSPPSQEGLRVLARHLLSRAEHPDGRRPIRFLLVIDHGADDPAALLIPDAADPRRPVVVMDALSDAEVAGLVADRLPGAELPPTDVAAVRAAASGMPGTIAALLAEGLRRGDVRRVDSRWIWMVEGLHTYHPPRTLPAATHRALEAATPSARDLLVRLALLDEPAPAGLVDALAADADVTALCASGLLARSHEGDQVRLAPTSRSLRDLLRDAPPATLAAHRRVLLDALAARPQLDLVPDEARLRAADGAPEAALARLAAAHPALSSTARMRAAILLVDLVAADASLLATPERRAHAIRFLLPGPVGTKLSDALVRALPTPPPPADDATRVALSEDAFSRSLYKRAVDVLAAPLTAPDDLLSARAAVSDLRARVALDAGSLHRSALADRLRHVRGGTAQVGPSLRLSLVLALARFHYEAGDSRVAAARARRAVSLARYHHNHRRLAEALNTHAICLQRLGRSDQAETAVRRSILLHGALGEVASVCRSLHNLARLQVRRGAHFEAAQSLARALSVSSRYADNEAASAVLLALAGMLDDQGNPTRALDVLRRAQQRALASGLTRIALESICAQLQLAVHLGIHERAAAAIAALRSLRRADPSIADGDVTAPALAQVYLALGHPGRAVSTLSRRAHQTPRSTPALEIALRASRARGAPPPLGGRIGRSPFRRVLARTLRLRHRANSERTHDRNATLLSQVLSPELGVSGVEHRLCIGVLLSRARASSASLGSDLPLLLGIAALETRRQHWTLAARANALIASTYLRRGEIQLARQHVDRCMLLGPSGDPRTLIGLSEFQLVPREFSDLADELAKALPSGADFGLVGNFWARFGALAYRLSLLPEARSNADGRVAHALRLILSHASRIKAGTGLEALLDALNDGARQITGAERACVVLVAPDGGREIRVVSSSSDSDGQAGRPKVSHTIIQRVLATRETLLVHDAFADSELMSKPSVASMSLRSALCVPLTRGDRLFGAMYADSRAGAGSFDGTDLEILALFGEQAAAAIEAARLLADAQRSYAELRSAQDRLVRGERLRVMGELAGGVAHEFNNILTAILARVQLLSLEPIPSSVRREIDMIQRAALDAAEVVRRLQTFSRTQRQTDFQRIDLGEVCADVVEFLRPLWNSRRLGGRPPVAVHLRTTRGIAIQGDPTEIREVLTNLLKNAVEALEAGGTVLLETVPRVDRVELRVQDDGPGVPPDLRARLFTPFFTTKGERGTGLGLCLTQQIVERHGGEIRLEPATPRGTRAVVTLPLATAQPERSPVGGTPTAGVAALPTSVLVVDDDPDVLEPLCGFLRRSQFDVRRALSGEEALELIRQKLPDVVISDIGMPGIDGLELRRRLRDSHPELPVVLMTGRASSPALPRDAASGHAIVIAKPFTMRQILETLAQVTGRGNTAEA